MTQQYENENEHEHENEKLTAEDLLYLRVAISLALTSPDIKEDMPKTNEALHRLY